MDTNNSKKRKNKQQNVSGESQQKFALNSSQSGEFIVPRMSNNTQSESSSVCDTSSQSVTADQANEANQSTPSTDKGVTLRSMIGNQVSPLGPQGPQAKFVGVGSFTPIPSNSDLSDKIDNLTKMMTNMNKKLKERGGGQNFSTSFWMRFSQAPLCRYRFKFIFNDIIFLLSGNIIEYICF